MEKNMKILLMLLSLLLGKGAFAQTMEILVLGSDHENKPGAEDYAIVTQKIGAI